MAAKVGDWANDLATLGAMIWIGLCEIEKGRWEIPTPAMVTAPMWASALPWSFAPVANEIDLWARTVP